MVPASDGLSRRLDLTTSCHTMQARGSLSIALWDSKSGKCVTFREPWLCKSVRVDGTSAEQLMNGVLDTTKGALPYTNAKYAALVSNSTDYNVIALCPDAASGNISLMKFMLHHHEHMITAGELSQCYAVFSIRLISVYFYAGGRLR